MSGSSSQSDANTWFAVLRSARASGDRELETLARRELDGLGYRVVVRRDVAGDQKVEEVSSCK